MTPATFKRLIRDLQVWCSSCMVAFSGSDPIAVLIGAKRPSVTLIHRIAVHPDHLRQGHGRHLLTSLSSKLAILGPPRIVAEVPESLTAACALFGASGFTPEAVLTDYLLEDASRSQPALSERAKDARVEGFVIPVTVDDLAANGLLEDGPRVCWERSIESLTARKDEIAGLAVASDERIEASVLYSNDGAIDSLRSFVDDGGARLSHLLSHLGARVQGVFRFPKVHPAEMSKELLELLGFRAAGHYRLYSARARAH